MIFQIWFLQAVLVVEFLSSCMVVIIMRRLSFSCRIFQLKVANSDQLFLCSLAIADILVAAVQLPTQVRVSYYLEILKTWWTWTWGLAFALHTGKPFDWQVGWVKIHPWKAGDILCRMCGSIQAFALYLSGTLVTCITLDRFMAVCYPEVRRARVMLWVAWIFSGLLSLVEVRWGWTDAIFTFFS